MTAGLGSSSDANRVLKQYHEMGQRGGICVISDRVFSSCIDPDHPMGRKEAGILGWPGCSLLEFEELMQDIPLTGQSITLLGSCAPSSLRLAYVVALAEKRGIDPREVHGGVIESPFENYFGQTDPQPFDLNLKLCLDCWEYVARRGLRMRCNVNSQHFQESGGNGAQAMALRGQRVRGQRPRALAHWYSHSSRGGGSSSQSTTRMRPAVTQPPCSEAAFSPSVRESTIASSDALAGRKGGRSSMNAMSGHRCVGVS